MNKESKTNIMAQSLAREKAFEFFENALTKIHEAKYQQFFVKQVTVWNNTEFLIMYESELKNDFYAEIHKVDNGKWIPENPKRILYKWDFNPHLEEYEKLKEDPEQPKIPDRFYIPVKELKVCSTFDEEIDIAESIDDDIFKEEDDDDFDSGDPNVLIKEEPKQKTKESDFKSNTNQVSNVEKKDSTKTKNLTLPDALLVSSTLRDLVTIIHKKPVSNKKWLNELIKSLD